MQLIRFELFSEDRESRHVNIDPLEVESVKETSKRPAFGGSSQVAVIRTKSGDEFTVYDSSRTTAKIINKAKESANND